MQNLFPQAYHEKKSDDLASGLLMQPFEIELKGFSFYAVYLPAHPKQEAITKFVGWLEAMAHE